MHSPIHNTLRCTVAYILDRHTQSDTPSQTRVVQAPISRWTLMLICLYVYRWTLMLICLYDGDPIYKIRKGSDDHWHSFAAVFSLGYLLVILGSVASLWRRYNNQQMSALSCTYLDVQSSVTCFVDIVIMAELAESSLYIWKQFNLRWRCWSVSLCWSSSLCWR